jgi:AcrR family transcriptional regulator
VPTDDDRPSRVDRRKARTRNALLDAARGILADGSSTNVSIQEITDRADVGFGSFYNHFTSKEELFEAAVGEVLEEHGAHLRALTGHIEDPAEVFATRFRLTARLASSAPTVATVFVRSGLEFLLSARGLAPMALHDIDTGMSSGRFAPGNPHLGLVAASGCLFTFLQFRLARPELVGDADADTLTTQLLVMLGVDADEADRIAHLPLPT